MLINRDAEKICGDLEDKYFGYHRRNQPAPKKICIYCRRYLLSHNEITPQIITAAMFKETSQIFSLTKKIGSQIVKLYLLMPQDHNVEKVCLYLSKL